jgi:uncharacterized protein with HEPN domain
MQRDVLLLTEMIDAAEQAQRLASGVTVSQLETDRQRRDALLWNFTVLGEAAGQVSNEVKARFPGIVWQQPARLRNRIVHGYWSIDLCTPPRPSNYLHSSAICTKSLTRLAKAPEPARIKMTVGRVTVRPE